MTPESGNWELLDPNQFSTELKELEDSASPQLVVPIPRRFGGSQGEGEEAKLEVEDEGFSIAKTKDEAERQRKILEDIKEVSKEVPMANTIPTFSNEDYEFDQKKMGQESNRRSEFMRKQAEEQKKKAKQQQEASKEFSDWISYILRLILL
jgi:hypothetical protein